MDLNNDGYVSTDEINQSVNIIFQLIDTNNDNKISLEELEELKEIVNILKWAFGEDYLVVQQALL